MVNGTTPTYEATKFAVDLSADGIARRILDDVNMSVSQNEIVGIVGRSGTGKTTLLRALGGLVLGCDGNLLLDGKKVTCPPSGVVTVFQDYGNALLPWRTVGKNIALPLEGKIPKAQLAERVARAIKSVGLKGREDDYLRSLSGGMQQRVQIARALILEPRVLLMDEPFGALDALTKATLQDVLLKLHQETDLTIIFITHDLEEAIYLSDTVYVIAGQPGTFAEQVTVPLPRPRNQIETREMPAYLSLRHRLATAIDLSGVLT